jgi:signal transduction histidine kinase
VASGPRSSRFGEWRRGFLAWAGSFDAATRRAIEWPAGWVAVAALFSGLLLLLAYHPRFRPYFQLQFWPVFSFQLLSLGVTVVSNLLDERPGLTLGQRGASYLAIAFCFQLFASSIVVFSQPPGTFALAALPILCVWFHAWLVRSTLRHPYPAFAHALGMAVALSMASDLSHLAVFAAVAPFGILGSLVSGTVAERLHRQRLGLEEQRSAICAQTLEARASEIGRLQETLFGILESHHDASNALSTALLDAHHLLELARAPRDDAHAAALQRSSQALREALGRVARTVEEVGELADAERRRGENGAAAIAVWPLAVDVTTALARRFPQLHLECRAESAHAERAEASVCGGVESLRRILENTVVNACEGEGGVLPTRIEVVVLAQPDTGCLAVEVRDDGPGFRSELLDAPISAFRTTKDGGTGLGLYTVERLVQASGGWVRRANRPGGGAAVALFLPEARAALAAEPDGAAA